MIYHPEDYGHSPNLPAIAVEDTTDSMDELSPIDRSSGGISITQTTRPPVELMQDI
jgi:hypothetical protein